MQQLTKYTPLSLFTANYIYQDYQSNLIPGTRRRAPACAGAAQRDSKFRAKGASRESRERPEGGLARGGGSLIRHLFFGGFRQRGVTD